MARKFAHALARSDIPKPHVHGAGQDATLVPIPREVLDVVSMGVNDEKTLAGRVVPHSDGAVPRSRNGTAAVRVENGAVDSVRVALEDL